MKNTTNEGAWTIKNTVLPLDFPTADEEAPAIRAIEEAANRLGAEVDGYDLDADDLIDGVSVTGPAEAIDALVGLFTGDEASTEITPLVIPTIDFFEAHNLINTLSENDGNDAAIIAIESWLDENAAAAAEEYARRGYADIAADILEIYGGEGDDDWVDVVSAINAARANEEEPANEEPAREEDPFDAAVANWRSAPENRNLDAALRANAADTNANPANLYRAGVFAGMVEAVAWQIYTRPEITGGYDDIHAIEAAIYQAYGVAW